MTTPGGIRISNKLLAVLCAIMWLISLPGQAQSVLVNPSGVNPNLGAVNIGNPGEAPWPVMLTIKEPAYVDMPIWAEIRFQGAAAHWQHDLRYPFTASPALPGIHTFEVMRDGILLAPLEPAANIEMGNDAVPADGPVAPCTAPSGRLPLHLCSRFDTPGAYSVRYVLLAKPNEHAAAQPLLTSNWVTVMVQPYSDDERRAWQQRQLAHPPDDAGLLVGDYLPALLASPDAAVLPAFLNALHHPNMLVRRYALHALAYFDPALLNPNGVGVKATLSIAGPACVGMPIWASLALTGKPTILRETFHYPYSANPFEHWRHAFEVERAGGSTTPHKAATRAHSGKTAARRSQPKDEFNVQAAKFKVAGHFEPVELRYGSIYAPPGVTAGRLPLHLFTRFEQPGVYRVRYLLLPESGTEKSPALLASNWVTLVVKPGTTEQRRQWQQRLMAHPPGDAGQLLGDYLPSLLASPDSAALPAFLDTVHFPDNQVQEYTLHALACFDDAVWQQVIFTELEQHGPTDHLAELLFAWQRRLSQPDALTLVTKLTPYLAGANSRQARGRCSRCPACANTRRKKRCRRPSAASMPR